MPEAEPAPVSRIFQHHELDAVASWLLTLCTGRVWLLEGEMGAGKTTLIKALCRRLGVKDNMSSPTFAIAHEYAGAAGTIVHLDLYRIARVEELVERGIPDYLSSGNYCLVEWPAVLGGWAPDDAVKVRLSLIDEQTRQIEVTAYGRQR
mgnify:FL=1